LKYVYCFKFLNEIVHISILNAL